MLTGPLSIRHRLLRGPSLTVQPEWPPSLPVTLLFSSRPAVCLPACLLGVSRSSKAAGLGAFCLVCCEIPTAPRRVSSHAKCSEATCCGRVGDAPPGWRALCWAPSAETDENIPVLRQQDLLLIMTWLMAGCVCIHLPRQGRTCAPESPKGLPRASPEQGTESAKRKWKVAGPGSRNGGGWPCEPTDEGASAGAGSCGWNPLAARAHSTLVYRALAVYRRTAHSFLLRDFALGGY